MPSVVYFSVKAVRATAAPAAARSALQPGPGRRMICVGSAVIGAVTSASRSRVGASGR
jgi:hypothetical protein